MSDQTIQAIEDAISAHLDDVSEDGDVLINWVIGMAYTNLDQLENDARHGYRVLTPEKQAFHITAGLVRIMEMDIDTRWNAPNED